MLSSLRRDPEVCGSGQALQPSTPSLYGRYLTTRAESLSSSAGLSFCQEVDSQVLSTVNEDFKYSLLFFHDSILHVDIEEKLTKSQ
jgi:hypothetical protein